MSSSSSESSPTPLLKALQELMEGWQTAFCQHRTLRRAIRLGLCHAFTPGHRMISRLISTCGREQQDWSADYKLFSRSRWEPTMLFAPALSRCVQHTQEQPFIHIAGDMTHVRKTGKKVAGVHCMRDPMSPPFHVNLIYGLRFLQLTCVLAHYRTRAGAAPRSVPVGFEEVPTLAKPGPNASELERQAFTKAKRQPRGMEQTLKALKALRHRLDQQGSQKVALVTLDGGFCNRTMFGAHLERMELICRARKDARLCGKANGDPKRFYGIGTFTPDAVRRNEQIAWHIGEFFHGGGYRTLRYKEVAEVYWRGGAKRRPLRLIVIAPTPYRLHKKGRIHYRQEAYLLTTDRHTDAAVLVQTYLDHWQIEVNHREEKSHFGIGDAQVRNERSVPRHPAFAVAVYALLLLAALDAYGIERTEAYLPLPKWRRGAKRPSCADMIAQLRREMDLAGTDLVEFAPRPRHLTPATLMAAA